MRLPTSAIRRFMLLLPVLWAAAAAQPPAPPAKPVARPKVRPTGFPERPPGDPASIARGKAIYSVNCQFCHGTDARGGSGGTNLIRAQLVMNDQHGELIGTVIRSGREGMPKFDMPDAQVTDIAAFLHSFRVGGYDVSRMTPPTIVVGKAPAGAAYFQKTCAGCHNVTGDLKGIASRIPDPKALQQTWLMPGSGRGQRARPSTVTVTAADGTRHQGRLNRIDDFFVTLTDGDGVQRTFTRHHGTPKVEVRDPLQPHKDLLAQYRDQDIHDVTAFLVTLK